MPVWMQVSLAILITATVLWFMFRIPRRGESFYEWAPPLALFSAWMGLAALTLSGLLWLMELSDQWVALGLLLVDPATLTAGILVLWIYRTNPNPATTIQLQRLQAKVGIALGLAAIALGYAYVLNHKTPFTPVGF